MNEVLEFLAENYIYVAGGSLLVIVILILIIVLGNKKDKKVAKSSTVSMDSFEPGVVSDIAVSMPEVNSVQEPVQNASTVSEPMPFVNLEAEPVNEETSVFVSNDLEPISEPVTIPEVTLENNVQNEISEPISNENVVTEVELPKEESVEAEVQIAGEPEVSTQVEVDIPVIETPVVSSEESNLKEEATVVIEPVVDVPETISTEVVAEEVKEAEPEKTSVLDQLEVFDVEEPSPKGSAVSGFSSVNIEK